MRMDGLVDGGDTHIVPRACQDVTHVNYGTCKAKTRTKRHCACVWTVGRWWDTYILPPVCFLFVISEKTVVGLSDIPRMIETHSYYIFNSLYKLTIVLHDWISTCQRHDVGRRQRGLSYILHFVGDTNHRTIAPNVCH